MPATLEPEHVDAVRWQAATDRARAGLGRLWLGGATPQQAVRTFGLVLAGPADWGRAVDLVAQELYAPAALTARAA